jgi:NAD-dependent dihydropyrimidine dehydrogenase PreA subunit
MSHRETVWADLERCTGCGACVEICPVEAITLEDGRALVDEETCTGCQACVDACPEGAIQPLVHGEIVAAQERPAPAVRQASPLAETAGAAIAAAGVGVLARVAGTLVRAAGRWLAQGLAEGQPGSEPGGRLDLSTEVQRNAAPTRRETPPDDGGRRGRGRRVRRRRRGG